MEDIHGLGLSELASTIGRTIGAFRRLRRIIREKPDLVILIDYAEFNLILSGTAQARGRARAVLHHAAGLGMAARARRQACRSRGSSRGGAAVREGAVPIARVGACHSSDILLLDRVAPASEPRGNAAAPWIPAKRPIDRDSARQPPRRVRYLLRSDGRRRRGSSRATITWKWSSRLAPTLTLDELTVVGRRISPGVRIIDNDTYSIVLRANLRWSHREPPRSRRRCSDAPRVIAYKVSPLTYILGRMLVTGVDYIGMPNILAGRKIVPELIQREVTVGRPGACRRAAARRHIRAETVTALGALREKLGAPGAAGLVAEIA